MVTKDILKQLADALAEFNDNKNTWENLREKCQQASQWLEHAVVKPKDRPILKSALNDAEKILLENEQYDPRRSH